MSRRLLALLPAFALLATLGLPATAQDPVLAPPQATPIADPPAEPSGDGTGVRLTTAQGDIVIGLFTESSPVAVENFLNLTNAGYYDGLTFHRLVPGFVIQGGDPSGDGTGGPGYTIPDEPVVGRYGRGIVAMARTPAPDSQGSQFFIVLDDEAERALSSANTYAIFGRVVEGMEVVDAIAAMPNSGDPENRALEPVSIATATVEQVTLPPEPTRAPAPVPGDPTLEAMFPTEVNGQPFTARSNNGAELREGAPADDPFIVDIETALASLGATFDQLSLGGGTVGSQDAGVSITGIRVQGADASAIQASLLPIILGLGDQQETPTTIAGRAVTILTDGPDAPEATRLYAYGAGDTVFLLQGTEPWLSDAIGKLP